MASTNPGSLPDRHGHTPTTTTSTRPSSSSSRQTSQTHPHARGAGHTSDARHTSNARHTSTSDARHTSEPTAECNGISRPQFDSATHTRANKPRKRISNACRRCRSQKVKCNGKKPCEQCEKRGVSCVFDGRRVVSESFVRELERRVAEFESGEGRLVRDGDGSEGEEEGDRHGIVRPQHFVGEQENVRSDRGLTTSERREELPGERSERDSIAGSRSHSPTPKLMNPLGLDHSTFALDTQGRPIYLGTSSTWSFGRRVLAMAHEQVLKAPLPSERLHWEGEVYDLDFQKDLASTPMPCTIDAATLPQADFALYLINTVKFYCGQMFHLFDEDSFMRQHSHFHDDTSSDRDPVPQLWQAHYLLILAFGKAFVSRNSMGRHPPGWELFLKGMQFMPNVTIVTPDPLETMEFFCCAALYLHSLDFRCSAFRMIGQALRLALGHGLHTSMESQHVGDAMLQRCRKIWWTIFVLDRQMTALMGVPPAMQDSDVTAALPVFPGSPQKSIALDLHVKLSKAVARIVYSVYGANGRLNQCFVMSTKAALKNIAAITEELNTHFHLNISETSVGMSRLAAYLHLLNHQCIVLATRPLFYSMLQAKLSNANPSSSSSSLSHLRNSRSVNWLAKMCIESAQQMLRIVSALQEQSLLESFLPFDLDSVFISTMILLISQPLLSSPSSCALQTPYITKAYTLLDEIRARGNLRAGYHKAELCQLEEILSGIVPSDVPSEEAVGEERERGMVDAACHLVSLAGGGDVGCGVMGLQEEEELEGALGNEAGWVDMEGFMWQDGIDTEQLMMVAETLDLDGMSWLGSQI